MSMTQRAERLTEPAAMWDNAEVAGLLDDAGRVCLISRNEDEAPVRDVLGKRVVDIVREESREDFETALRQAPAGAKSSSCSQPSPTPATSCGRGCG